MSVLSLSIVVNVLAYTKIDLVYNVLVFIHKIVTSAYNNECVNVSVFVNSCKSFCVENSCKNC